MKMKFVGGAFLVMGGIVIMAFFLGSLELGMFKFFSPKREQVKREVFEQSKEYLHGTIQELDKMYLEYAKTNDSEIRKAIEIRALRMTAEFDENDLPDELWQWTQQIKAGR